MPDIDPRFDPAFQRGFSGPARIEPPLRVEPVETTTSFPSRVEPVETSSGHASRVEPAETSPNDPVPALHGNPWMPALWVTAAALIVLGVAAMYIAQQIIYSPTAPSAGQEYVIPVVLQAVGPTMATAGLACGVAALIIHAIRWRPA